MKHLYTWSAIFAIAFGSVIGDVLLSRAMKQVGDVGVLVRQRGAWMVVRRTAGNPNFLLGIVAMSAAFFSLLFALSWGPLSVVAPASASLVYRPSAVLGRAVVGAEIRF